MTTTRENKIRKSVAKSKAKKTAPMLAALDRLSKTDIGDDAAFRAAANNVAAEYRKMKH